VYVGGFTASTSDLATALFNKLPMFLLVIIVLGFVLLTLAFRSVVIPAIGAAMNVLTMGVAFGAVVLVFQYGFGSKLLGAGGPGPIEGMVPVLVVGIMFGLSMDYQVFLVSRMHEEWSVAKDNRRAVRVGQTETGKVIAIAAAIMFSVFISFAAGGVRLIAEFGIGLSVAVLMDAFIIRMLLVPALMHVIGNANWWLPKWLDKAMPHISVEGEPEPADLESAEYAEGQTTPAQVG
jgi:RND superfamily putative drug exporter